MSNRNYKCGFQNQSLRIETNAACGIGAGKIVEADHVETMHDAEIGNLSRTQYDKEMVPILQERLVVMEGMLEDRVMSST